MFLFISHLLDFVFPMKEVEQEAAGKTAEELIAAKAHGIDIDEELETDICKLWDMTANQVRD